MTEYKIIHKNNFLSILVFILISLNSFGQNENEKAILLFESQNFTEALPYFQEAYKKYPDNKNILYYLGVCFIETGQFNIENSKLLLLASKGDVPLDINFFIGKNYHALNQFQLSNSYYQMFLNKAKKRDIKDSGVKELHKLSIKRINPFEKVTYETTPKDSLVSKDTNTIISSTQLPDSIITETTPPINGFIETNTPVENVNTSTSSDKIVLLKDNKLDTVTLPQELIDSIINFNISTGIVYLKFNQFRTIKGKSHFLNGWEYSKELTTLVEKTNELRKKYESAESFDIKNQLSNQVLGLEIEIFDLKRLTDDEFLKSRESENSFWQTIHVDERNKIKKENDSIQVSLETKKTELEFENKETSDSLTIIVNEKNLEQEDLTVETPIEDEIITKPENEVVYKIQIGAFKTELPPASKNLFKKLSVLRKIDTYTDEKKITYYTIGEVTNFKDAVKLQDQVRKESIKDAFIIIFKDGKKLSFNEAKQYMK